MWDRPPLEKRLRNLQEKADRERDETVREAFAIQKRFRELQIALAEENAKRDEAEARTDMYHKSWIHTAAHLFVVRLGLLQLTEDNIISSGRARELSCLSTEKWRKFTQDNIETIREGKLEGEKPNDANEPT